MFIMLMQLGVGLGEVEGLQGNDDKDNKESKDNDEDNNI